MRPPVRNGGVSPVATGDQGAALTPSPSGTWATPSPLKRAALNFRPFVTQSLSWVLPGVLTAFCPKRKIAPRNLAMGDFNLPPIAASDSRHNLRLRTTVSRGAAGRVRL